MSAVKLMKGYQQIGADLGVLNGWTGPQPVFDPAGGCYICNERDGQRLKGMIDYGLLPSPGVIPGDRMLSLTEMMNFQIRKALEEARNA